MLIYVPDMNSLALTVLPEALYTDNSDANRDDANAAKLYKMSWPLVKFFQSRYWVVLPLDGFNQVFWIEANMQLAIILFSYY